jgi:hypothetical protein
VGVEGVDVERAREVPDRDVIAGEGGAVGEKGTPADPDRAARVVGGEVAADPRVVVEAPLGADSEAAHGRGKHAGDRGR